jgi:molybdate transport system substrate-binding protein
LFQTAGIERLLVKHRIWLSLIAIAAFGATTAPAAEVTVLAAGGIQVALERMAPDFERTTGYKIKAVFGPGGATKARIIRGEPFDVTIVQSPYTEIIASGNIIASSETPLATVAIGLAVPRGAPKPDISTREAVKKTLLTARLISYPDPAAGADAGISVAETLQRLGIAEQVAPKVRFGELKLRSMTLVAKGDVDLGMTYVSEIGDPGVELVGSLPSDISTPTVLVAFVSSHTQEMVAAQALMRYMAAPAAEPFYRSSRLLPYARESTSSGPTSQ